MADYHCSVREMMTPLEKGTLEQQNTVVVGCRLAQCIDGCIDMNKLSKTFITAGVVPGDGPVADKVGRFLKGSKGVNIESMHEGKKSVFGDNQLYQEHVYLGHHFMSWKALNGYSMGSNKNNTFDADVEASCGAYLYLPDACHRNIQKFFGPKPDFQEYSLNNVVDTGVFARHGIASLEDYANFVSSRVAIPMHSMRIWAVPCKTVDDVVCVVLWFLEGEKTRIDPDKGVLVPLSGVTFEQLVAYFREGFVKLIHRITASQESGVDQETKIVADNVRFDPKRYQKKLFGFKQYSVILPEHIRSQITDLTRWVVMTDRTQEEASSLVYTLKATFGSSSDPHHNMFSEIRSMGTCEGSHDSNFLLSSISQFDYLKKIKVHAEQLVTYYRDILMGFVKLVATKNDTFLDPMPWYPVYTTREGSQKIKSLPFVFKTARALRQQVTITQDEKTCTENYRRNPFVITRAHHIARAINSVMMRSIIEVDLDDIASHQEAFSFTSIIEDVFDVLEDMKKGSTQTGTRTAKRTSASTKKPRASKPPAKKAKATKEAAKVVEAVSSDSETEIPASEDELVAKAPVKRKKAPSISVRQPAAHQAMDDDEDFEAPAHKAVKPPKKTVGLSKPKAPAKKTKGILKTSKTQSASSSKPKPPSLKRVSVKEPPASKQHKKKAHPPMGPSEDREAMQFDNDDASDPEDIPEQEPPKTKKKIVAKKPPSNSPAKHSAAQKSPAKKKEASPPPEPDEQQDQLDLGDEVQLAPATPELQQAPAPVDHSSRQQTGSVPGQADVQSKAKSNEDMELQAPMSPDSDVLGIQEYDDDNDDQKKREEEEEEEEEENGISEDDYGLDEI